MTKPILSFILSSILSLLPVSPATAQKPTQTTYAVVETDGVYFYSAPSEEAGLFILPYSYYVQVVNTDMPYSFVRYGYDSAPYKAQYGYCKTSEITPVTFEPKRPYLSYQLTVKYTLGNDNPFAESVFSEIEETYAYYGNYTVGSGVYYFVGKGDKTGYIPKTEELLFERNVDYIKSEEKPQEGTNTSTSSFSPSEIVWLCVLLAVSLVVIFFLFRGKKQPKH